MKYLASTVFALLRVALLIHFGPKCFHDLQSAQKTVTSQRAKTYCGLEKHGSIHQRHPAAILCQTLFIHNKYGISLSGISIYQARATCFMLCHVNSKNVQRWKRLLEKQLENIQ